MKDNWIYPNQAPYYFGGKLAVNFYNEQVTLRRENIPYEKTDKFSEDIKSINDNGFVKWKQAIDHDLIDSINDKVSYLIDNKKNLKMHDDHYSMIADPFLHVEESFQLAFSDHMLDFAGEYFNCYPALGTFNLRRSYSNSLQAKTTQLFHCDRNSIKFFKFFIYLNDVDDPSHGPLTIIKGSHKKRPLNVFAKHRWEDKEVEDLYGKENFHYLTAKKGDLIAATTTCFHKGNKPTTQDRTMLTLNYVVHPELAGGRPGQYEKFFKIKKSQFDSLIDQKKHAAEFLEKV